MEAAAVRGEDRFAQQAAAWCVAKYRFALMKSNTALVKVTWTVPIWLDPRHDRVDNDASKDATRILQRPTARPASCWEPLRLVRVKK